MHSHSVDIAVNFLRSMLIFLLTGTVGGKVAEKIRIPDVVLYILIGILLSPSCLGIIEMKADSPSYQVILLFGASFILFHGGMITHLDILKQVWRTIILLSTVGMIVTALVVSIAAVWVFHIPFLPALLLGAILASTDPAALVPIFNKFPVRHKVSQTVITESAFTDATGAIMTTVVFSLLMIGGGSIEWGSIGLQFVRLAIGGILVGSVIGWIAAFLISENDRGLLREFTPMVIVITVLAAYLVAERIHASGFMSVFVAGIMIGNAAWFKLTILPKQEHAAHDFIEALALKLRMLIFILLGSQVDFKVLQEYGLQSLLIVLIFMFVARPLTVLLCLLPDRKAKWQKNEVLFMFWTRETGVIAAALVGIVASSGLSEGKLMSAIVFVAILSTLLLQASTTPAVAKNLRLLEEEHSTTVKN
ncbi:sodium:proton antiporter [Collibacillus ludicampi]|uniref:Sodium:proton antiporter n=1 Tax=Collibacillus ludicampi TaxID=2771369 RepID=A0AAV4LES2_9BACL|nr:sodium:proton antiporter [Collibacillus ludicampi]GIM46168.1 sodium:proton antiporter [Collibacillus ludicampi]